MTQQTATIEVDKATADTLRARAAERGISVAQLLAEVARDSGPVASDTVDIAELDRRWAKVAAVWTTISELTRRPNLGGAGSAAARHRSLRWHSRSRWWHHIACGKLAVNDCAFI